MRQEIQRKPFKPQRNLEFCIRMIKDMKKGISLTDEYMALDESTQRFLDKLMTVNGLF